MQDTRNYSKGLAHSRVYAIDIETMSQGDKASIYTSKFEEIKAPANYKDKAKIDAYIENARKKAHDKHALSWWTGMISCVCLVEVNSDERKILSLGRNKTEKEILERLANILSGFVALVTMNGRSFDYAFLVGRYMANQLPIPAVLKDRYRTEDISEYFGFSSSSSQRGKLRDYAWGTNQDPKTMDIEDYFRQLDLTITGTIEEKSEAWDKIEEYCMHDAEIVAEIYRRYHK